MKTDTSEKGLECLIVKAMTGRSGLETSTVQEGSGAIGGTVWLAGDRPQLDVILDACREVYKDKTRFDEHAQVDFKGKAKSFCRTYDFLASILPYTNASWEKLSIFLNFISKLPTPEKEDLAKGILEAIDIDSYRAEKKATLKVSLPDENAETGPVPVPGGWRKQQPELARLSNILKTFNDQFATLFTDADRVRKRISEDIPPRVATDTAYVNAKKNKDPQNARIEHDKALLRVMTALLKDDTELFKQFSDNESFRRWLTDTVFQMTYE